MGFSDTSFFNSMRTGILGPTLAQSEIDGCNAILTAMTGTPLSHCSYAFATAFHETAGTMQPVREAYWLSEAWRKSHLRYYPWYGRGYVQLTWDTNYKRADDELGLGGTLIKNLDRALELPIAAQVMRRGMEEGWFAADSKGRHTLKRHLPAGGLATAAQFKEARRIINGVDRADMVARYALQFQAALQTAGW
jgi:hypothetical protein